LAGLWYRFPDQGQKAPATFAATGHVAALWRKDT
jgi:hypothetical protein